jgi:hypothetical protein
MTDEHVTSICIHINAIFAIRFIKMYFLIESVFVRVINVIFLHHLYVIYIGVAKYTR